MFTKKKKGFTITEFVIVLVVVGIVVGGVLKGAQMVRHSRMKRQAKDMSDLASAVFVYYGRIGKIAGDNDGDGLFDSNDAVWDDLECLSLVDRNIKSPYGQSYRYCSHRCAGLDGSYVYCKMSGPVGRFVDRTLDDGDPSNGVVQCVHGYEGKDKVKVVYFIYLEW